MAESLRNLEVLRAEANAQSTCQPEVRVPRQPNAHSTIQEMDEEVPAEVISSIEGPIGESRGGEKQFANPMQAARRRPGR